MTASAPLDDSTVTNPASALRADEIRRYRAYFLGAACMSLVGVVCAPFFGVEPWLTRIFQVGMFTAAVSNASIARYLRRAHGYDERRVMVLAIPVFAVSPIVIYFFGFYSPYLALVTVGQRRSTRVTATRDDLVGQCDAATHFIRE